MRLYVNEGLVRRRVRASLLYLALSLLFLVGGFLASVAEPDISRSYLISFSALAVGIAFWARNQTHLQRWGPRGRQDGAIARALKGLDNRYELLCFAAANLPDYLLVGPFGVLVLVARPVSGQVRCEQGRWRHDEGRPLPLRALLWFAPRIPLGNPEVDAHKGVEAVRRHLNARVGEGAEPVTVEVAVVLTHPRSALTVQGCSVPALLAKSLRGHVRRLPHRLGAREVDKLAAAVAGGPA